MNSRKTCALRKYVERTEDLLDGVVFTEVGTGRRVTAADLVARDLDVVEKHHGPEGVVEYLD